MTEQLPDPLVPAHVDLRGYEFMPFYGDRAFGSEAWIGATDEARVAMLKLWWRAYSKEVPAGSLPDRDILLCDYAGYGVAPRAWKKVREQALRGFIKCSDGRLYHRVVAVLAIEAWDFRHKQRNRTEAARLARQSQRLSQTPQAPPKPSVTESTGQDRTGQDKDLSQTLLSGSSPDVLELTGDSEPKKVNGSAHYADAEDVLGYLNRSAGKGYEFRNRTGELTASAERIIARLKQGYTREELREVVHAKCEQWSADDRMAEYLRPITLFGKEKFEQYLGELRGTNG